MPKQRRNARQQCENTPRELLEAENGELCAEGFPSSRSPTYDLVVAPSGWRLGAKRPCGPWALRSNADGGQLVAVPRQMGQQDFWRRPLADELILSACEKYEHLASVLEAGHNPGRHSLRECASRWPGSLRELELVSPQGIRARGRLARSAAAASSVAGDLTMLRAMEASPALLATLIWSELHAIVALQLSWRHHVQGAGEPEGFVEFATRRRPELALPTADIWQAFTGAKTASRQAYLWLSAWSGFGLQALYGCLFERVGFRIHRPTDPFWCRWQCGCDPESTTSDPSPSSICTADPEA